jgi:tetratricopeptide (TPR) repeat protein
MLTDNNTLFAMAMEGLRDKHINISVGQIQCVSMPTERVLKSDTADTRDAKKYEKEGFYHAAAKLWLEQGNLARAAECAVASEKKGLYVDAADIWKDLGELEKAAEAYEKADAYDNKGPIKMSYLFSAAQLWAKLDRRDRAIKVAKKLQRQHEYDLESTVYNNLPLRPKEPADANWVKHEQTGIPEFVKYEMAEGGEEGSSEHDVERMFLINKIDIQGFAYMGKTYEVVKKLGFSYVDIGHAKSHPGSERVELLMCKDVENPHVENWTPDYYAVMDYYEQKDGNWKFEILGIATTMRELTAKLFKLKIQNWRPLTPLLKPYLPY